MNDLYPKTTDNGNRKLRLSSSIRDAQLSFIFITTTIIPSTSRSTHHIPLKLILSIGYRYTLHPTGLHIHNIHYIFPTCSGYTLAARLNYTPRSEYIFNVRSVYILVAR